MSLYTLDIQVPLHNGVNAVLSAFQDAPGQDIDIISTNLLYSEMNSAYYRFEIFSPRLDSDGLLRLMEAKLPDARSRIREDLSLYKKPLIEIQAQKSLDFKRAFMATSPAALKSAVKSLLSGREELKHYNRNRLGLISNGTALESPHQVIMQLERDAFLISRHAGSQAVPIWFNSKNEEEFLKSVLSIAPNYFLMRLSSLSREYALDIADRAAENADIPVIHAEYIETAGIIAAILRNAARIHSTEVRGKIVGIIGLGPAGHGLKEILVMMGVSRVYGIDSDTRQLTRFEKKDGTATSIDHLYENADFIIITPGTQVLMDEKRFHEGQIVLSFVPDLLKLDEMKVRVRERTYQGYEPHPVFILPGLISAFNKYRLRKVTPDLRLRLSETLLEKSGENRLLPIPSVDLFRNQAEALEDFAPPGYRKNENHDDSREEAS